MGLVFKHVAVRMWAALFLGSLTALVTLPPLANIVGPGWMVGPALMLIAAAYWLIGIAFASLGRRRLNRLINEAAIWDRAGMAREARQALTRAESTLKSYYFSPFSRKQPANLLLAQLARFQLSQSNPESSCDAVVGTYLRHFPRDRDAAFKWLEGILAGRPVTQQTHDIAAGIGAAHVDDITIQRMLAQFYLAEGCCDFSALKTYRRLVDANDPLADGLLNGIIDLFISQERADNLALEVYVTGHQRGRTDFRLVEGIAACRHRVQPTPLTRPFLESAEAILAGIEPLKRQEIESAFLSAGVDGPPLSTRRSRQRWLPSLGPMLRKARGGISGAVEKIIAAGICIGRQARRILLSRQTKTTVKWAAMGLFGVGVGWLLVSTTLHLADGFKPVETVSEPVAPPITDPFTLQVAAYLKEDDARRFVNQLKKKALDAYWTRASGNDKTWYQVRVSHFETKKEARAMGEHLKAGRLISDYYVANYKRPDGP